MQWIINYEIVFDASLFCVLSLKCGIVHLLNYFFFLTLYLSPLPLPLSPYLLQDVIELRRKDQPITLAINIYSDEVRQYEVCPAVANPCVHFVTQNVVIQPINDIYPLHVCTYIHIYTFHTTIKHYTHIHTPVLYLSGPHTHTHIHDSQIGHIQQQMHKCCNCA